MNPEPIPQSGLSQASFAEKGETWVMNILSHPYRYLLACLIANAFVSVAAGQMAVPSPEKTSNEVFKRIKVFKSTPSDQLIPAMQFISASLGVQCEFCHVERAFDRDDKEPKQIARRMIQMTMALNDKDFEGKQVVSCYSCHRGHPKPVSIPVIPDVPAPFVSSAEPQPDSAGLPKADQVLRRYTAAIGGPDRINRLRTISEKGSVEAGSAKFPIEVLKAPPGRISTLIHYPAGDSVAIFDGSSGWILLPDRPLRPMNAAEADSNRMDAAIPLSCDFKNLFADLQTVRRDKLSNQDVLLVRATRPNLPPVELYFDENSGLLTRIVRYARSPLGLLPNQIDFSDYRDVGGMKVPFHWISATPLGRFTVQIATVTLDVPLRNDVFSKPTIATQGTPQER